MGILIFNRVPGGSYIERKAPIAESRDSLWFQDLPNTCKLWTKDTEVAFNVLGCKYYPRHALRTMDLLSLERSHPALK